jgi:hypothetical protein
VDLPRSFTIRESSHRIHNPLTGDELAGQMRAELASAPARHVRYVHEYLGWGVFALMDR